MRVVFDTVVLVRSLLDPYGSSGKLFFERGEDYEWLVSPEIVTEYLEVTQRPKLIRKYRTVESRDLDAILAQIATATLVFPTYVPAICRDPTDDKFLAAAQAGDARFIVSEDNDLLELGQYEQTVIVSTRTFLALLDEAEGRQ